MSLTAFLLVFAAAFAHAGWNIIAHGASRTGLPFLWWGSVFSLVLWVGAIPFTGGIGTADWGGVALGVGVSAILHVAYMLLLQRGYASGELSTVYATARGTGPLLTLIVAILLLDERPSYLALSGVLVVIAGVVAMGLISKKPATPGAAATARSIAGSGSFTKQSLPRVRRLDPSLIFGLLTGVAIAAYTVWDTHALREWGISPVAFMVGCTALEIPLFSFAVWHNRRELVQTLRIHWGRLLLFGILAPLSYILVLTAVTIAPVSLVAPVREVSVVLVSLFGAFVFHESRPVPRLIAALVVTGGIILLGLG